MSDVIFALASAQGRAGVAVIRLSGDGALELAASYLGGALPVAGRSLRKFRHQGEMIDEVLALSFAKGASFTGEEVVELHCHGSPAVTRAILAALAEDGQARFAEAGEFTRRALENGRLDLAQVEGLADLIEAETEAQRRQASRVFTGALSDKVTAWRSDLIRAVSLIEATIDFADEDVPVDVTPEVSELIKKTIDALQAEADGVAAAERIRDGFEVAIVGKPNMGKSTLLNALAGREAAITSEVAGTTRDVIEVRMEIGGLPVTLLDTAGLRDASDSVEQLGVGLARRRAQAADLRLFLTQDGGVEGLGIEHGADDIIAISKSDVNQAGAGLRLSGKTGDGVSNLLANIAEVLGKRASGAQTATKDRHRIGMVSAINHLLTAEERLQDGVVFAEITSHELRDAIRALDILIGKVDVEDMLDEIFSSFCIGK